jgi:hypothetical protein
VLGKNIPEKQGQPMPLGRGSFQAK